MRKWLIALFIFVLLIIGYLGFQHGFRTASPADNKVANAEDENKIEKKEKVKNNDHVVQKVELDKGWDYSFDKEIDPSSLNNKTVSVIENDGQSVPVDVSLQQLDKTIHIAPPSGGYKKGTIYHLTMTKGIAYKDGSHVSKKHTLTFVTKRDKVVDGKLNPNITKVETSSIQSFDGKTLKIDKSAKKDLKAGDILVLPSEEEKEGQAVKVVKVTSHFTSYEAEVTTPHFSELFEKLDVYGSFPIKPENFQPNKDLEGISVQPIAYSKPNTMIASSEDPEKKGEYFSPKITSKYSKENGFQIILSNLNFKRGDKEFKADGMVQVLDPYMDLDTDITTGNTKRLILTNNTHMESHTNVRLLGKDGKYKGLTKVTDKNKSLLTEKFILGTYTVPLPEFPLVYLKGTISLKIESDFVGEAKVSVVAELDDSRGVMVEDGKTKPFSNTDFDAQLDVQGHASASLKVGPAATGGVYLFGIGGAGAEVFGGYKAKSEIAMGKSTKLGHYFCYDLSEGPSISASAYADTENLVDEHDIERLFEWTFIETDLGMMKAVNTCNTFTALVSKEDKIELKAGQSYELPVEGDYLNILSDMSKIKKIENISDVDITFKQKNTAQATKQTGSNKIIIKANSAPGHEETDMVISYHEKSKATGKIIQSKLTIPVSITNYKEIEKKQTANLNGDWTRNIQNAVGNLKISKSNGKTFYFTLSTLGGGYTGDMEGTANVNGNKGIFKDTELDSNCVLNFDLKKKAIAITENEGCAMWHGALAGFDGTYDKGKENVKTEALSDVGALTPQEDSAVKQLVGSEYKTLSEDLMQWDEAADPNMEGARVISGGVPQMYMFREAIIIIKDDYYYVAFTKDDNKILYYSNDPTYASMFPGTIEDWSFKFEGFSIKIMN